MGIELQTRWSWVITLTTRPCSPVNLLKYLPQFVATSPSIFSSSSPAWYESQSVVHLLQLVYLSEVKPLVSATAPADLQISYKFLSSIGFIWYIGFVPFYCLFRNFMDLCENFLWMISIEVFPLGWSPVKFVLDLLTSLLGKVKVVHFYVLHLAHG